MNETADLLNAAWPVIANAGGGDWERETEDWRKAAIRWRDRYHQWLSSQPGALEPGQILDDKGIPCWPDPADVERELTEYKRRGEVTDFALASAGDVIKALATQLETARAALRGK